MSTQVISWSQCQPVIRDVDDRWWLIGDAWVSLKWLLSLMLAEPDALVLMLARRDLVRDRGMSTSRLACNKHLVTTIKNTFQHFSISELSLILLTDTVDQIKQDSNTRVFLRGLLGLIKIKWFKGNASSVWLPPYLLIILTQEYNCHWPPQPGANVDTCCCN